jgi:hypothetical protein
MTYLHIHDQGLRQKSEHPLGDRRTDHVTAENIRDALRARGMQAVAQAMAFQQVALSTALRVLANPDKRRERPGMVVDAPGRRPAMTGNAANQAAMPACA